VVHDPSENIFIRPNDVIFVTREAPTFAALNQNVGVDAGDRKIKARFKLSVHGQFGWAFAREFGTRLQIGVLRSARRVGILKRPSSPLFAAVLATLLPACSLLPGTGPTSEAVNGNATAGVRSSAPLPYALVDVTADTIGFLSQPNFDHF
jgi:hypothetical protein